MAAGEMEKMKKMEKDKKEIIDDYPQKQGNNQMDHRAVGEFPKEQGEAQAAQEEQAKIK